MKSDLLPRQLLLALALIGLMMGCGGNKDTEEKSGESGKGAEEKTGEGGDAKGGSNQSAAKKPEVKKADLAASLSGKRIVFSVSGEGAPPPSMQQLFQFETDGTFKAGTVENGKAMGESRNHYYEVKGLKISILKNGEADVGITFLSSSPKNGNKFTVGIKGLPLMTATISKIEKAGPLAKIDFGPPPKADPTVEDNGKGSPPEEDLSPLSIDLSPPSQGEDLSLPSPRLGIAGPSKKAASGSGWSGSAGLGPNGEVAKSKHPAFIAHTWKISPSSKGGKQIAIFDKTGTLTITVDKSKPIKGTWAVAGTQITLTYPKPETGKEQAKVYKFRFGGSKEESDGKTIKEEENLYLKGVGDNKTSIAYERTLGP